MATYIYDAIIADGRLMLGKQKIYISGQITGTKDYMDRFENEERRLYELGFEPINPAKICAVLPESFTHEEYMRVCLSILSECDGIVMLHGWEKSYGANAELCYALATGKNVYYKEAI